MKAILFKNENGVLTHYVYQAEELMYEFMRKICSNSDKIFCVTKEDLDDFKEICLTLGTHIEFKGMGLYDTNGNYFSKLNDCEGTFWIDENYTEVEIISKIKIVDNKKIIFKNQSFQ